MRKITSMLFLIICVTVLILLASMSTVSATNINVNTNTNTNTIENNTVNEFAISGDINLTNNTLVNTTNSPSNATNTKDFQSGVSTLSNLPEASLRFFKHFEYFTNCCWRNLNIA